MYLSANLNRYFTVIAIPAIAILAMVLAAPALATELKRPNTIKVQPQPLASALQNFSKQSGMQVAYVATLADNVNSKGTHGARTPAAALSEILEDTGLNYEFVNHDTVTIARAVPGPGDTSSNLGSSQQPRGDMVLAQDAKRATTDVSKGDLRESQAGGDHNVEADSSALEEIVVTGSRIRGKSDFTSPNPVLAISGVEIRKSGATEIERFLAELPQVLPGRTGTTVSNGQDGTSSINLRGLGEQRALTLVNGRRFVPSNTNGVVDYANIPVPLVERVELVTGGASAVYGSDAVAGVVNVILKDDFEGVEFRTQLGQTNHSDGARWNASLTMGSNFDEGRGNATVFLSVDERDPIWQRDREWESQTYSVGPSGLTATGGSSFTPGGAIFGVGGVNYYFTEDGGARPFSFTTDAFNYKDVQHLQSEGKRINLNSTMRYELVPDELQLFVEGMYANSKNELHIAPTLPSLQPVISQLDFDPPTTIHYLDNPFLQQTARDVFAELDTGTGPDLVAGDGVATFNNQIRLRMLPVGLRIRNADSDTYRILAGLRARVSETMDVEAYFSNGRVSRVQTLTNAINENTLRQGVDVVTDSDGGPVCFDPTGGCVPINIFGEGNMSAEAADYLRLVLTNVSTYELRNAGATISGTLPGFSSDPIGYAAGYEWRSEKAVLVPDSSYTTQDIASFRFLSPAIGRFSVHEGFLEVDLPLVGDRRGVNYLGVNGAARYSDYDTSVGGITTYHLGAVYGPLENMRLRAQFQRAVRAPSIAEAFQGPITTFPANPDFCVAGAPSETLEFCQALGVPGSGVVLNPEVQVQQSVGGNSDLMEETAETVTVGLAYEPMDRLSVAIDYYDIVIKDYIGPIGNGAVTVVNGCRDSMDVNSDFCKRITRGLTGQITDVDSSFTNNPEIATSGIDLKLSSRFNVAWLNSFSDDATINLRVVGNYILESTIISNAFDPVKVDCAGVLGRDGGACPIGVVAELGSGVTPEWSWNTSVDYQSGPLGVRLGYRYIDAVTDERVALKDPAVSGGNRPNPDGFDAQHYVDLTVNFDFNERLGMYFGAVNLLDREPPITGQEVTGPFTNTATQTYDPIGRFYFLGADLRF